MADAPLRRHLGGNRVVPAAENGVGMYTEADITYLRHGDVSLLARLYRPAGTGPFPAVVDVHGGAWTMFDRSSTADTDRFLAESGIIVLAPDFRLGDVAPYPGQVTDVNFAIRWLKAHAEEFGSSPELVGGLGASSGGHVILLNAIQPIEPAFTVLPLRERPELTAELGYVVACWPITDAAARYRLMNERGDERLVRAHDTFWHDETEMASGSPEHIVASGAAMRLPPVLIVHGTADEMVPPTMIARFAETYRAAGGLIDVHYFDGEPHGFIKRDPTGEAPRRALAAITSFVNAHAHAGIPSALGG